MVAAAAEMYLCGSFYSCHFLVLFNDSLSVYFPMPFHMKVNLVHLDFLPSYLFPFASFIFLIPLLVVCHSPHFLPNALVFLASSKLLYTTIDLVHQRLSDVSDSQEGLHWLLVWTDHQ